MKTLLFVLISLNFSVAYKTPVSIYASENQNVVKESLFSFQIPESFLAIIWPKYEYGQTALVRLKKTAFANLPLFSLYANYIPVSSSLRKVDKRRDTPTYL